MKKYRVDYFGVNERGTSYFDTKTEADKAGHEMVRDGFRAFLLELRDCIGKYDVVAQYQKG